MLLWDEHGDVEEKQRIDVSIRALYKRDHRSHQQRSFRERQEGKAGKVTKKGDSMRGRERKGEKKRVLYREG